MSEFGHSTDIYPIGQMSEYVLFYGHLSHRLDVYRSDGVTPMTLYFMTVSYCLPTYVNESLSSTPQLLTNPKSKSKVQVQL